MFSGGTQRRDFLPERGNENIKYSRVGIAPTTCRFTDTAPRLDHKRMYVSLKLYNKVCKCNVKVITIAY